MESATDSGVPQWKRDLIERIRNKNKWPSEDQQQLLAGTPRNSSAAFGHTGHQPGVITCSSAVPVVNSREGVTWKCNESSSTCTDTKMVKERVLVDHKQFNNFVENGDDDSVGSGSSEELHYGPGIVNKLKNRYLSLTLRESNAKTRPSILPMRKATSLEHLLDDDVPNGKPPANSRVFQSKWKENARSVPNRYNATRSDLKRARSVEAISRSDDQQNETIEVRLKHESVHEDMLIAKEGSDKHSGKMYDSKILEITESKFFSNSVTHIINRPKRIPPIMSEKEKPPVDVVKQTKKIFEGRAEQRTKPPHQTGEVAAKVATYKTIIGQTRNSKKPPIPKQKPVPQEIKTSKLQKPCKLPLPHNNSENGWLSEEKSPSPDIASIRSISSPIPDISRINSPNREEFCNNNHSKTGSNLSETPDLILHSSPVKNVSPTFRILATDNFLKAEIIHSNSENFWVKPDKKQPVSGVGKVNKIASPGGEDKQDGIKKVSTESRNKIQQAGNTVTYNLSTTTSTTQGPRSHLPIINKEPRTNCRTVAPQPPKNAHASKRVDKTATNSQLSPSSISKPLLPAQPTLTPQEIEKNSINTAKTLEQVAALSTPVTVKCEEVKKVEVPKTTSHREQKEQNSIVFKFTDRKDVPDYVGNDGRIRSTGKIEKPKVGEGGIILLPGVSLDESATDDDDDWMLSLEGPPSPCDVMFINDNVLIDGRSSLSQKSKKSKMKIKFVEAVPQIFEYPSEASLLDDFPPPSRESSPGHVVPTLSGSSLANYIPKSGSTEDFQLGITRSLPTSPTVAEPKNDEGYLEASVQEVEEPVLFSAGTNSDILF